MTFTCNGLLEVARHINMQNFSKLSAAVHELSCPQRKKKNLEMILLKTMLSALLWAVIKYRNAIK